MFVAQAGDRVLLGAFGLPTVAIPQSRWTLSARAMILACWCLVSLVLVAMRVADYRPHHDADDLLKLYQLQHVLETGSLVDRVLPNIAQPEPYVSHWTWIADAPYLAVTLVLQPLLGQELALSTAAFAVPLLLLLLAFGLAYKIVERLGFETPAVAFVPGVLTSAFAEFQPDRIDYHSLQMVFMLGLALTTITAGRRSALVCGLIAALSFSVSAELAAFIALALAIYSLRYVAGFADAARELSALGVGLLGASVVLFVAVNPLPPWLGQACDQYSLPHVVALAGAGLSFIAAPRLSLHAGVGLRLGILCVCGAATTAVLLALFPQCLAGPYGVLSPYVHQNLIQQIGQEKSVFSNADYVLSGNLPAFLLLLVGPGAIVASVAFRTVQGRAWTVAALFAGLGILLALSYLRYQRFVPWLGGPGWAIILATALPAASTWRRYFASRVLQWQPNALLLVAPTLLVATAVLAVQALRPPTPMRMQGTDLAEYCASEKIAPANWPVGTRVLAPPLLAVRLLRMDGPEVVSIPFHRAAPGLERTLRFFDPATPDPWHFFEQTGATHVAVCALTAPAGAALGRDYPFTFGLMTGRPPDWLAECPAGSDNRLRIYRVSGSDPASCPQP